MMRPISPIHHLNSPREIIAEVVGRTHTPRRPMCPNFPLFLCHARTSPPRPTRCLPLPRQTTGAIASLFRRVQHNANIGRQRFATIPPRPCSQVIFADTSAHEDTYFHRHEAYLAQENVKPPILKVSRSCWTPVPTLARPPRVQHSMLQKIIEGDRYTKPHVLVLILYLVFIYK